MQVYKYLFLRYTYSTASDDTLPDGWCRESFLEVMKDVPDFNTV